MALKEYDYLVHSFAQVPIYKNAILIFILSNQH